MTGRLKFKSLQTRFLSALVMGPAVMAILYFGGWLFVALILILAAISLFEWCSLSFKLEPPKTYIYSLAGVVYVGGSFACCYIIFETLGFYWALTFLFMVWGSDIGAYFAGKMIGGPKMIPSISPNKTWAGTLGAIAAAGVLGVLAMFLYRGIDDFSLMAITMMGLSGLLIGLSGQLGDLLISTLKRKADVKDTGTLIPGHGGLLDRIDSMLFAAPVYLLLFHFGHG